MAAQLHLAARGKPAQFVMDAVVLATLGHEKRGFRKIIFCSDFPQQLVI